MRVFRSQKVLAGEELVSQWGASRTPEEIYTAISLIRFEIKERVGLKKLLNPWPSPSCMRSQNVKLCIIAYLNFWRAKREISLFCVVIKIAIWIFEVISKN